MERQRRRDERPSAVTASLTRQSSAAPLTKHAIASRSPARQEWRESMIGVATTTTSIPVSSSNTPIAPDAHSKHESISLQVPTSSDRPVSTSGASEVGRLMLRDVEEPDPDRAKVCIHFVPLSIHSD